MASDRRWGLLDLKPGERGGWPRDSEDTDCSRGPSALQSLIPWRGLRFSSRPQLCLFLIFLCNGMVFPSFSASVVGDMKEILEMVFPFNLPLLRSHSLVSDRNSMLNVDYKAFRNQAQRFQKEFILQGCEALEYVILS